MKLSAYTGWRQQGEEILLACEGAIVGLSFSKPDVMRLRFNTGDAFKTDEVKMVVETPVTSACFTVFEETNGLHLQTEAVTVLVQKKPLAIAVYTPDGRLITKTKLSGFGEAEERHSVLRLALTEQEGIYGLGQDPMGNLNQRGHERRMWNEWGGLHVCANAANPFYLSSNGYGLLLNNGWPSLFAVGEAKVSDSPPAHSIERAKGPWDWGVDSGEEVPDELSLVLEDGRMDVFFIFRAGEKAITGYTELTGFAPMPPKWALGYMQSKNRYRSRQEFLTLAKQYREKKIPCDVLVLDWLWFQQFGDMEWDGEHWDNPKEMLGELHRQGYHVMQAYHPFIYEDSLKVGDFREKGYLMRTPPGTLPIYDHSNPEAREEWWQQTKKLAEQGIDAYWIDMGEPRDHPQGTTCHLGSREQVHNLYSNYWAKGLYDGHRRDLESRIFSLSRTSYAGIQRYGAALWSNDIDSSWEVLRDQVPAGLGVCLSGIPYWCTDIGGFATDDRFSAELYIRWLQWGVFCPLFRTHGTRPDNEPWSYGIEAEHILTDFIRLRYRLMPYIYTCARAVTESGTPMMRALCLDFPEDPEACAQKYSFLFGPSLLVAPVLEKGVRTQEVYLPQGIWYDFWSGQRLTGGRTIRVAAPLNRIPLFVREGAVIPMAEESLYVGENSSEEILLHVYGAEDALYTLYEDDGVSYGYETGRYVKTTLTITGDTVHTSLEGDSGLLPKAWHYKVVRHTGKSSESPITIDCDQNTDGSCSIYVSLDSGQKETVVRYEILPPSGFRLTDAPCYLRKTPLPQGEKILRGADALRWNCAPIRELLPLRNTATLRLTFLSGGEKKIMEQQVTVGSGALNRGTVIGFFDPDHPTDAAIMERIEAGDWQPWYIRKSMVHQEQLAVEGELSAGEEPADTRENRIYWNHHAHYNCHGYFDLRRMASVPMKNGKGVGYAAFRIYCSKDQECQIEFSAERSFGFWLNGEKLFTQDGISLLQKPSQVFCLKKGYQTCLVRCDVNNQKQMSGREIGFSLRFWDLSGKEIEDLMIDTGVGI